MRLAGSGSPVGAVALLAAGVTGLPALIERFDVAPQALARERPYVAARDRGDPARVRARRRRRARAATPGRLSRRRSTDHRDTVENVPLWDSGVLRAAMNETQSIGGYYGFTSTTVDRYGDRL